MKSCGEALRSRVCSAASPGEGISALAEIPGGHAGALFEQLAEIVLIAVSHFKGNVAGAHLGGFQQSFCLVDAQQGQVFNKALAGLLPEQRAEIRPIVKRCGRQVRSSVF